MTMTACDRGPSLDIPAAVPIDVPAGAGAALPHVADSDAGAILSWVEPAAAGHALLFARWDGAAWSDPVEAAAGTGWFVNWADFPSVISLPDGSLAAHWLQRSAESTYAYDVLITRSLDDGATWSPPVRPHTDATPTEHGFVSLFPLDGALGVVWLDGRQFADADGAPATNEMTVRFAALDGSALTREHMLDGRACDCCQTDVALTARGPLLVYRDRSEGEVRDIAAARLIDGAWTPPHVVHNDEWVIDACPVNGPQAHAIGDDVAVAWFTAARDTPRVNVAFSHDAGATFTAPVRVDGGNPAGRVDVLLLDAQRALVVWLERVADGAEVRARLVHVGGAMGEPSAIAETLARRPGGFPRMARHGDEVLLAWTEPGDVSRVRAAVLDFAAPADP